MYSVHILGHVINYVLSCFMTGQVGPEGKITDC